MFGLFKLKKKSKKDINVDHQSLPDDEKENTSSPIKVKKIDNKSSKKSSDKQQQQVPVITNDIKVEKQQAIEIQIVTTNSEKNKEQSAPLPVTPSIPRNSGIAKFNAQQAKNQTLLVETDLYDQGHESQPSSLSTTTATINVPGHRVPMLSASDANTNSFVRGVSNFLNRFDFKS